MNTQPIAIRYTLPLRVVNGSNAREHWSARARRAKRERQAAYLLTPRYPLPCVVTLTRIGKRRMDGDGATIALKHVRDGIADRLGVDDADPRVTWRYQQRTGDYAVEVELAGGNVGDFNVARMATGEATG